MILKHVRVPDKQQHQGCSGRERPCYSEPRTLVRERSASAVLLDCRKHVPLWCSLVWPDFQFLWYTQDKRKYYLLITYITINSAHSPGFESIHLQSGLDWLIIFFSYLWYHLEFLLCFDIQYITVVTCVTFYTEYRLGISVQFLFWMNR